MRLLILLYPTCALLASSSFAQSQINPIADLDQIERVMSSPVPGLTPDEHNEVLVCAVKKVVEPYTFSDTELSTLISDLGLDPQHLSTCDNQKPTLWVPQLIDADKSTEDKTTYDAFSVNTIADGIAKFLVKRTKEELSAAFFRRFQELVDNNEMLTPLFPATSLTLAGIGDDIYRFQVFIETLRESFVRDLRTLPGNLAKYLDDSSLLNPQELQYTVADVFQIAQMLADRAQITDIIHFLGSNARLHSSSNPTWKEVSDGFRFVALLSNWLQTPEASEDSTIWMRPAELSRILSTPELRKVAVRLISHQLNQQSFHNSTKYVTRIQNSLNDLEVFAFYGFNVYQDLKIILDKPTKEVQYEDYYPFFQSIISLLNVTLGLFPADNQEYKIVEKTIKSFDQVISLILAIRQKHYASAVLCANTLLQYHVPNYDECHGQLFIKYGTFIATVAKAQSSDEVALAIEAAALPVGSSSIKRNVAFNVSLNAYTGINFGREYLAQTDNKKTYLGVAAPVGIGVSTSRNGWSHTGFVSLIDVGTIATYRFNDANTADLPELKWSNIIAPGFHYIAGISKTPISIGFGAQLGPNFREVDVEAVDVSASNWRFGITLAVDIPLLNFHSSGKSLQDTPCGDNDVLRARLKDDKAAKKQLRKNIREKRQKLRGT